MLRGDDELIRSPGGYIPPGEDIVRAGPNGLLETLPPAGDDATWFPNLYDDLTLRAPTRRRRRGHDLQTPSPLLKYDQLFNTSARCWEAVNSQNKDISRWPGHCLGGAVASILLNEPIPAPGTGMTKDELKALWAELGENHYNHRIGDYATEIPPGPPRPAPTRPTGSCPRPRHARDPHPRQRERRSWATCGRSRLAARSTRSGTTASASTSPSTTRSPAAARVPSTSRSRCTPTRARCSTARTTRTA